MTGLLMALTLLSQPPVAGAQPLTARQATAVAVALVAVWEADDDVDD